MVVDSIVLKPLFQQVWSCTALTLLPPSQGSVSSQRPCFFSQCSELCFSWICLHLVLGRYLQESRLTCLTFWEAFPIQGSQTPGPLG